MAKKDINSSSWNNEIEALQFKNREKNIFPDENKLGVKRPLDV